MTTATQLLAVARSQLGTCEAPDGSIKYGQFYGLDKVAWCAQFVYWCLHQTTYPDELIPKTAYTPTLAEWYRNKGWFGVAPRVGSLVFYNWPDAVDRIQHVGFIETVYADGTIGTIEGNTTSGVLGDQSHGGGVWRRRRTTSAVVGYGHPAYTPEPGPESLPTLAYGTRSAAVARVQGFLNRYGWKPALPLLSADGDYGAKTKTVVAAAQKQMGITGSDADGSVIGPRTNAGFWARGYRG